MSKPIAISFFTGAMGLDLGIEQAGFDIRLASDIDKACQETIGLNRPKTPIVGDIMELDAGSILKAAGIKSKDRISLVAGGPPCQSWSTMGRRMGLSDKRGTASEKYINLVSSLKPDYIVMENVRGLFSIDGGKPLADFVKTLENTGYSVSFDLYDSANFGVPQNRERIVIMASLRGKVPYLSPTHCQNGLYGLERWRTFRDAVSSLPESPRDFVRFSEKRLRFLRMLKEGQDWRDLPEGLQKEALGGGYESQGGKTSYYRRLFWDKPSPTVLTSPVQKSTMLCHPIEDRPLSVQEYMRIQQFPDDWRLAGSVADKYRQVGNAVPVGLGRAIGETVMAHIEGRKLPSYDGFKYSRYSGTSDRDWLGGVTGADLFDEESM